MNNLMTDISTFRIAPTASREALSALVGLAAVTVVAVLVLDSPPLEASISAVFAAYGLVRVVIAANRARRVSAPVGRGR